MENENIRPVTCAACGRENEDNRQFCIDCGKWLNNVPSSVVNTDDKRMSGKWVIFMPMVGLLLGTVIGVIFGLGMYAVFPIVLFTVFGSIIGLIIAPFTYSKEKGMSALTIIGIWICSITLIIVFLAIKYKDHW